MLTVESCEASEFRCDDGSCITENYRCDDSFECPDRSDENNCKFITILTLKTYIYLTIEVLCECNDLRLRSKDHHMPFIDLRPRQILDVTVMTVIFCDQ